MSLQTNFDSNLGNYVPDVQNAGTAAFDGSLGNPSAGCARLFSTLVFPVFSPSFIIDNSDVHVVLTGEHLYFNARFLASGVTFSFNNQIFYVRIDFSDALALDLFYYGFNLIPNNVDSGWLQFDINLASRVGKTINYMHFGLPCHEVYHSQDGQEITAYIDSVEFATSAPPFDPNPPTPSGNRTWIYKSIDGGDTWASRGVKTIS